MHQIIGSLVRSMVLGLACLILIPAVSHAQAKLEVVFEPSFHPLATITVVQEGRNNSVIVNYKKRGHEKTLWTDEYELKKAAAEEFFRKLDALADKMLEMKGQEPNNDHVTYFDGIKVSATYSKSESQRFSFSARSPTREDDPAEFAVIKALFDVIDKTNMLSSTMVCIEQLRSYFPDLGLPVKVYGGYPYRVRFFGSLSTIDEPALRDLIVSLPADVPLLIDMSNFEGMGTALYIHFQGLLMRNKNIRWIASKPARKQLLEIGVAEKDIQDAK